MAKLWENKSNLNNEIEDYTVENDYILDKKLVKYDCIASIAHAKMLGRMGHLEKNEALKLIKGLEEIIKLDEKEKFEIKKEDEDCHTAIENHLVKKLGNIGKKIHFARSRNDQVLTALRLYEKDEISKVKEKITALTGNIYFFAKKYRSIEFPGYTHTRKAMPSSIELWADSFAESMADNIKSINSVLDLINQSPLGTGAGYGLPVKVEREYTAKLLGFKKIQQNPIYCQNSRGKFESTILNSLSQIMYDLNKISSDIILFSTPEIGYFELSEKICTGSSIMPHKRNPDVLELVRANYNVVNSYEFQVKNISTNLISCYNRDIQMTKEPLIKGFDITKKSISVMSVVFDNLHVNKEKCKKAITKELYSVEEAYNLAKKMAFRDAYKEISRKY